MSQNYNQTDPSRDFQQTTGRTCASAPSAPDTVPSLLDEVAKMAHEVRTSAGIVADALSGPIPADGPDGCSTNASNVMDSLRLIRSTLGGAIQNQQRIRNTLSL